MIEDRLRALADDAFPPTPDLASWAAKPVIATGLAAHGEKKRRFGDRRWLLAALVALLVPAAAVAVTQLWPKHVRIIRVAQLPPLPTHAPPNLGRRINTIAEATNRAGFPIQTLDRPAAIRVRGDLVTLIYPDVVITEVPARRERDVLVKEVGPGTIVERVAEGWFLSGAPHEVAYVSPDGRFVRLPPRLAGNTLAIERDGLVIRIEGERLTRARALQLSQQLARRGTP